MSEKNGKVNGHARPRELARTPHYLVLSRERASALFGQLLVNRRRIDDLARHNAAVTERYQAEANLLVLALHELARARKEKEPDLFIRNWLASHHEMSADAGRKEQARVGA
jgi:hypothetical protein